MWVSAVMTVVILIWVSAIMTASKPTYLRGGSCYRRSVLNHRLVMMVLT